MAKVDTGIRTRNIFDPTSTKPFKLSRSRLERFLECPRCFYLDRRLGIDRPDSPPFTLNNAVDELLKREFDQYRSTQQPHPCTSTIGLNAYPFSHDSLGVWRHNFTGVQFHHEPTNLIIHGAIDDIWINSAGELIIVDYKATSIQEQITAAFGYRESYRRQLEIYQWLFRQNQFAVCDTAYLVYVNARKDRPSFENRLDFDLTLIPCVGKSDWVESCIQAARDCLHSDVLPEPTPGCAYCLYRSASRAHEAIISGPE
ncbi:MAG: PD-(D/E)XK nuclease family protein [Acidobacteria bacterium]|nr:PD-(D/E)XK nuclease family protein [Acidobacteriota bacterium]